MANKAEWAVVGAALLVAIPVWKTKDWGVGAGDIVEEPITLVPEDKGRLSCMRDRPVGRYACAFRTEDDETPRPQSPRDVIAPYMTTTRVLYLVAGLFEDPAVAEHLARKEGGARFTARCRLRLVEIVDDYELKFAPDAPWGKGQAAWVAEPVSCKIVGE